MLTKSSIPPLLPSGHAAPRMTLLALGPLDNGSEVPKKRRYRHCNATRASAFATVLENQTPSLVVTLRIVNSQCCASPSLRCCP